MEYTKLGNSDLTVSRICMGCMGFGDPRTGQHSWTIGEERSREVLRQALELGINFFDTAIGYQNGTSEAYLGRALRDFAKREDVVVATKFPGILPTPLLISQAITDILPYCPGIFKTGLPLPPLCPGTILFLYTTGYARSIGQAFPKGIHLPYQREKG